MTAKKTWIRDRCTPESLLFLAVALGFALCACSELSSTEDFADVSYMAAYLDDEESANKPIVADAASQSDAIVDAKVCRSDILADGLPFVMRDIELQNSAVDYDSWVSSLSRAERYVTHAISCSPADGDLWARLAMLKQAAVANPEQISKLMARSQSLSPAELYVLQARFVVWNRAGKETLRLSAKTVDADLRTMVNYGPEKAVREMIADAQPLLKPLINSALQTISAERSGQLKPL